MFAVAFLKVARELRARAVAARHGICICPRTERLLRLRSNKEHPCTLSVRTFPLAAGLRRRR